MSTDNSLILVYAFEHTEHKQYKIKILIFLGGYYNVDN